MTTAPDRLLQGWLQRQLPAAGTGWLAGWLDEQLAELSEDPSDRVLHIARGMAPRRLARDDLDLSDADLAAAAAFIVVAEAPLVLM